MVKMIRLLQAVVCIGLLTAFMGCAATQKHESTGQYVDDSVITTKVKAAIFKEDNLKTLQINVTTKKGVVHLEGAVDSAQNVARAAEVAKRVDGVALVENGLVVKK
jgi:osmotically-inducible protein OsmY